MRTLHITVVTETFPPEINGVAMTVGRLVSGMRHRGHRVDVVRPRQRHDLAPPHTDSLVRGLPLPGYPDLRLGLPARRSLLAAWRKERPDVVHVVTEGPLGWSAVSAARRLGIPTTSGFHTNFDHYSVHYGAGYLRPAISAYLRSFHRRTQATLVPTTALAAELAGEGIPGVRVVGRGVDTRLFSPQHRCSELRRHWFGEADGLACLYVGRLAPEKNLVQVEQAFAAIQAQQPTARMIWVGDGPARKQLEASHTDHCFAGARTGEDLARHYASADLFLFPSLTETYGNVVAEAMASGVAPVAYRSAAAAELIRDGENGRTVIPGDRAAFIQAALDLSLHHGQRFVMADNARHTALSRDWESVISGFEGALRQVMNDGT